MKRLVLGILVCSSLALACSSDFDCGIGHSCVKKAYSSEGVCMKNVDEYGTPQYNMPSLDSIGPNMNSDGECTFSTDCPIGFRCDSTYKVCVKR